MYHIEEADIVIIGAGADGLDNRGSFEESAYSWITVDPKRCNKCGICIDMCPMDVLHFASSGYPFMRYRDDCWYCDVCVFMCPRHAITLEDLPYLIR